MKKGSHHTQETKDIMRKLHLGKKYSLEQGEKISKHHQGNKYALGCKHTESGNREISKAQCGNKHRLGKHLSEEIKLRISESLKGEKHWNWQGGITCLPYCKKWTNELREEIRKRDNNICQNCGKNKEENNNRKLSVHHIHYDKENCYPDLITLCCSCNFKVNYNRLYWEYVFMSILTKRKLLNYFGDIK